MNNNECIASYALFRRMCDSSVTDLYLIIADFLRYTIFTRSLRQFDIFTLTQLVNDLFGFHLIDAVVKRSVKKLSLTSQNGLYNCNPEDFKDHSNLSAEILSFQQQNKELLESLCKHVSNKLGRELSLLENDALISSFNSFLLDNSSHGDFMNEVAEFVILCKDNPVLYSYLKQAKEGIVIYSGLNYKTKTDDASKKWTNEITVYLDTEVLFHMAGYNGETYKRLFDDFFGLVNEVNSDSLNKNGKKKIILKYFNHTLNEINTFFDRAESIVKGDIPLISSVTAMKSITSGCKTPSDVTEKKTEFNRLLVSHGILDDDHAQEYYDISNYRNNIECEEFVAQSKQEIKASEKDIYEALKSLSHIFVLRNGFYQGPFERDGYILLTDNYITRHIAWSNNVKEVSGNVLCTDLYYFTDRLWCRLGKSFGTGNQPIAYDVVSRAQVILSSHLNYKISEEYDELLDKYQKKEISLEHALEVLSELRLKVMNPEDIQTESNVSAALQAISSHGLEAYIQEKERKELDFRNLKEETKTLKIYWDQEKEQRKRDNQRHKAETEKLTLLHAEDMRKKEIEIARITASKDFEKRRQLYIEKRNLLVSRRLKTTKQIAMLHIGLLLLFSISSIILLFLPKFVEATSWYTKTIIIVLGCIIPQLIPIVRTYYFAKSDMRTEVSLLFNRQDSKRILMQYVHIFFTPPSLRICIDEQMKEKGLN